MSLTRDFLGSEGHVILWSSNLYSLNGMCHTIISAKSFISDDAIIVIHNIADNAVYGTGMCTNDVATTVYEPVKDNEIAGENDFVCYICCIHVTVKN